MAETKPLDRALAGVWAKRGLAALQRKKVKLKVCPQCQQNAWEADANNIVTTNPGAGLFVAPPVIPVLILVCNNCGFLAMHSLLKLGVDMKPEAEGAGAKE